MKIMLKSGEALFKAGKLVAGFSLKAVTFVITVALVKYFGVMLLFPLAIVVGIYTLGRGNLVGRQRVVVLPLAITCTLVASTVLASLLDGQVGPMIPDALIFGGAAFWLFRRPGVAPLLVLTALQLLGFAMAIASIETLRTGSTEYKGLLMATVFRILSVAVNMVALRRLRSATYAPFDVGMVVA